MFPIAEERLPLAEIAMLWAEEIMPRRSTRMILHELARAWWKGELHGDGVSRLDIIRSRFPIGLADELIPPGDPATWLERDCAPLFEWAARVRPVETTHSVNKPSVSWGVIISRHEFINWVKAKAYHHPKFWGTFPPDAETAPPPPELTPKPIGGPSRKRGPKPKKREAVVARMKEDIASGVISIEGLRDELEKTLEATYGASRDTVRRARNAVLGGE